MDIEELICMMKRRPLMYIEKIKVDYISYFLDGYLYGKSENKQDVDKFFQTEFRYWVLNWAVEKREYKLHSFYWYRILLDIAINEEEAVTLFFKLVEEFFTHHHENEKD